MSLRILRTMLNWETELCRCFWEDRTINISSSLIDRLAMMEEVNPQFTSQDQEKEKDTKTNCRLGPTSTSDIRLMKESPLLISNSRMQSSNTNSITSSTSNSRTTGSILLLTNSNSLSTVNSLMLEHCSGLEHSLLNQKHSKRRMYFSSTVEQ